MASSVSQIWKNDHQMPHDAKNSISVAELCKAGAVSEQLGVDGHEQDLRWSQGTSIGASPRPDLVNRFIIGAGIDLAGRK